MHKGAQQKLQINDFKNQYIIFNCEETYVNNPDII